MTAANRWPALATTLAAALVLSACGKDGGGPTTTQIVRTTRIEAPAAPAVTAAAPSGSFSPAAVYKRAAPGVVTVFATGGSSGGSEGSGFVVNGNGEIATNAHVVTTGTGASIKPAPKVFVRFTDDNQVPARIVGFDPFADVALLRVDAGGLTLHPLALGSSSELVIGTSVAAIGSPFGEERSLSVGIVSATGRAIDSLTGFSTPGAIQTDAAINQGNSGGPLLDGQGRVLGINSQIETSGGAGSGVGFAVPVDAVRRSLTQLRSKGRARYAYLGVATAPVYPQLDAHFKLGTPRGAWIQELTGDGPAKRGGVRAGSGSARFQTRQYVPGGDVVVAVDGHPVRTEDDLAAIVSTLAPGSSARLLVVRDRKRQTISVKLGERPLDAPPRG